MRVPKKFFDDHYERDLPTPTILRETSLHYFIEASDPNLSELLDDAKHYAENVDGCDFSLVRSARALVAAIITQTPS